MHDKFAETSTTATTTVAKVIPRRIVSARQLAQQEPFAALGHPSIPPWAYAVHAQVSSMLSDPRFPCLFARQAHLADTLWFQFIDSFDHDDMLRLRDGLREYLNILRGRDPLQNLMTALVVCFKPVEITQSVDWYHDRAWRALQFLHDHDPSPWPQHIPVDAHDPMWSFCFDGEEVFVNVSTPAHKQRRSRNLGDALTLVMQPRRNFDIVAGNSPRGRRVREQIRRRMSDYDDVPAAPHLGTYGDADNHEWMQYALGESNDAAQAGCPLHIRSCASTADNRVEREESP